ncbi:MAG: putative bifunctional diguanylate cyclase/phosphodiesterase [Actinomycetota bacterium]
MDERATEHTEDLRDALLRARVSEDALPQGADALAAAEHMAQVGAWTWDAATQEIHWSPGMHALLGRPPEGTTSMALVVHPDDIARYEDRVDSMMRGLGPFDEEYRILRPDGSVRWLHGRAEGDHDQHGRLRRVVGFVQDITERKEAERRQSASEAELARHHRILEAIAAGAPLLDTLVDVCRLVETDFPGTRCSVLLLDADGTSLHHVAGPSLPSEYLARLDGLPVAEGSAACGTAAARNQTVIVEDTLADPLTAAFEDAARTYDLRSVWSQPLRLATGEVAGCFAVYRSVTHRPDDEELHRVTGVGHLAALAIERGKAVEALTTAAQVDALTGLPNRNQLLAELQRAIDTGAPGVAVLFLDLDRFKWINDSQGHPVGDGILAEVGRRLSGELRDSDLLARFGGDEFTILLRTTSPDQAERVAERVAAAFQRPFLLPNGAESYLSASVGIAFAEPGAQASEVVRNADAAMYAAKEAGRARHALYDAQLRERAVERVSLETQLRHAIERAELVLHYQPLADLHTDEWRGVESLVRWEHPERGLVTPDQFIPLAEETGLIVPLGAALLDQAAAQARRWADIGFGLPVGVNTSIVQLADAAFPDLVGAALARHRLDPSLLVIEVTETSVMEHLDAVHTVLERIAALGVRITVDDFGTGYSSIARMRDLPVVSVKVDRAFTRDLGADPKAATVLSAITDLAHALDLAVVAEGVETAAALDVVRAQGCDVAQGYLLARPAPAGSIEQLLRSPPPTRAGAAPNPS